MTPARTTITSEADAVALLQQCGALLYGEFTLTSGKKADYYFDSKQLTLTPEGAFFVADQLVKKLNAADLRFVGGTAYSAIPIASHICLHSHSNSAFPIDAFYIRKESKGHGTEQLIEGKVPPPGTRVAIVEDVVTTGGSLLEAIAKAEEAGYNVTDAIVLVDRDEGGREAVEAKGQAFWSLFTVYRAPDGKPRFRFNGV